MRLKTNYWERFHKNLNKVVAVMSMNVKELGDAFGRVAKILRDERSTLIRLRKLQLKRQSGNNG